MSVLSLPQLPASTFTRFDSILLRHLTPMVKTYENADIKLTLRVKSPKDTPPDFKLNPHKVYQTILGSPWNGNQPLSSCLKGGKSYDWEFCYECDVWVQWEFELKTKARQVPLSVVKTAVERALA